MERFEAFENVLDLAEAVVTVCEIIVSPHLYIHNEDFESCTNGWSWDADTKTRAQGILASFRNFEFSVCIIALINTLLPLPSKLQKRDLDIYEAFCDIDSVTSNYKTCWRGREATSNSWKAAAQI